MQVEICLCGLYSMQRINTFRIATGTGLAASEAASKMNGGGSGHVASMQVIIVVGVAVHSARWNVSSLCET